MSVDPRTLGWLGRALNHELSAVQQYLAQSVLARLWGNTALAAELRQEAVDELGHAERLMERLILAGVAPSAGTLPPARLGKSPDALLAADEQLELDAVRLYQLALGHAQRVRDMDNAAVLQAILKEEAEHVRAIQSMAGETRHG